jgi:signal transduction histidine kinase
MHQQEKSISEKRWKCRCHRHIVLFATETSLTRGSVSISDDGTGLSPGSERKLIEPFQTGNTVKEGAGLGLAIVQEIMAAHGGALIITSTPGCGTTATLRFPEASQPMLDEVKTRNVEATSGPFNALY